MSDTFNLPVGSRYTPIGTPYHITQLVTILLKKMFAAMPEDSPYKWSEDTTTTGVVFDTIFNKDSEVVGNKPIIIVSRGSVMSSPIVLGDRADFEQRIDAVKQTTMLDSAVVIKVASTDYYSTDVLAQHVYNILVSTRGIITRLCGLQRINGFSLGEVARNEQAGQFFYYTVITISYASQFNWTITPENEQTLLRALSVELRSALDQTDTRTINSSVP